MATSPVTQQPTAWDAAGNPIAPAQAPTPAPANVTAWDAAGNPIQPQTGGAPPQSGTLTSGLKNVAAGVNDAVNDVGGGVENAVEHPLDTISNIGKGIWNSLPPVQLANRVEQSLPIIDAYEKARSGGASVSDALTQADLVGRQHDNNMQTIQKLSDDFKKNPTRTTASALSKAGLLAASMFSGAGEAAAAEGAGEAGAAEAATTTSNPSLVQQLTKGADVAQAPAQSAIRSAVGADADAPMLEGGSTVTDQRVSDLQAQAKDAYARRDAVAGFDTKEAEQALKDAQYSVKQPGQSDEVIARTQAKISDLQSKLGDAKSAMKEAGVDPNEGPKLYQSQRAGQDFTKALRQATSADGASVNVDSLLTKIKNLQATKYGNRVEQFLGKDGAAQLQNDLLSAQAQGVHAMKTQALAGKIAKYAVAPALGAAGGLAYEALK